VPPDDDAVLITMAPEPLAADAPAGELLAAAPLLLPPLEHAATSNAAPTAPLTPAASLAGGGIRFTMEFLIVFFSCLARPARASSRSPDDCRYRYVAMRERGLDAERQTSVIRATLPWFLVSARLSRLNMTPPRAL
jgi:hypothetical protein